MTLRAYLITMRGRVREALVPELQVLRDQHATLRARLAEPEPHCGCHKCNEVSTINGIPFASARMILCPTCGNKRCPHASDHRLACTDSNEPGQAGSVYYVLAKPETCKPALQVEAAMAPPARRPLTDEEIDQVIDINWAVMNYKPTYAVHREFARAIERAHKITGGNDE